MNIAGDLRIALRNKGGKAVYFLDPDDITLESPLRGGPLWNCLTADEFRATLP